MPKRRTEDAVHVVMTDHYIQRQRPSRDLLAERTEADSLTHGDYRGEVVLVLPAQAAFDTGERAVSGRGAGSAGIESDSRYSSAPTSDRATPSSTRRVLLRARARARARLGIMMRPSDGPRKRCARDAAFVPALKELATAAIAKGELSRAAQTLEKVIALRQADANALADLGNVYLQQGRDDHAYTTVQRALAARSQPSTGEQHDGTRGAPQRRAGGGRDTFSGSDPAAARSWPRRTTISATFWLGGKNTPRRLITSRRRSPAIPTYVDARHSYGVVLALMRVVSQSGGRVGNGRAAGAGPGAGASRSGRRARSAGARR